MRARLYLDVDGVLNARNAKFIWGEATSTSMTIHHPGGYTDDFTIHWAPDLILALEVLRTKFDVELVWLTTWNENNFVLTHLVPTIQGLAGGRVLPYDPPFNPVIEASGWWKGRGLIKDQAASPTPFIWIDDQEVSLHGQKVLTKTTGTPSLLIPTSPIAGLTPEHLEQMSEWLKGLPDDACKTDSTPASEDAEREAMNEQAKDTDVPEKLELNGTEGGLWRVYTRDSSHIFDLDRGTVTRVPGADAPANINDGPRRLKELFTCRVGERGYWTLPGDYLIDFRFNLTSTIQRIQKFTGDTTQPLS